MKIAITLCASLGGLIATAAGLVLLDELASGDRRRRPAHSLVSLLEERHPAESSHTNLC